MDWFGVHPLLATFFMAVGGFIACMLILAVIFIRDRISYNYQPSRRKVRSTYIRK